MKIKLILSKEEVLARFAKDLNVGTNDVELIIVEDNASEPKAEPQAKGVAVSRSLTEYAWFRDWMEANKVTCKDVADLCGVVTSTVSRLRRGYRCCRPTLNKIVKGLGLSNDEAKALRASLTKHQPRYDK